MPSEIKSIKCNITDASIGLISDSPYVFGLRLTFSDKNKSEWNIVYGFSLNLGTTCNITAMFPFFVRALLRKANASTLSELIGQQATVLYTEHDIQKTVISFYLGDDTSDFNYIDNEDLVAVNKFRSYLSESTEYSAGYMAGYGLVNIRRTRTDRGLSYKIIPDFDEYPNLLGYFT